MDLIEIKNRKLSEMKRHPWELARLEVVNALLRNTIKNENNFNILDIGCGDIFFISCLSEIYPNANFYAIDIAFTDEIIDSLRKSTAGKNIFLFKTLHEAEQHMKGPANLILLLDVVEHIQNDIDFLVSLRENKAVTEKTNIMITVPAFQSLFCSHDHFLGHFRRYTNKSLHRAIRQAGFTKTEKGYFFSFLLFPRIIQVLNEKMIKPDLRQKTTGLVEWNKGSGITNLIKNILLLDYKFTNVLKKLTGLNTPGLSNYMLCKKSV